MASQPPDPHPDSPPAGPDDAPEQIPAESEPRRDNVEAPSE